MTGIADPLGMFAYQGKFVITAMGIVALHATVFHRRMNKRLGVKIGLLILMTGVAGIVSFSAGQELGKFTGMVGVASCTIPHRDRTMLDLALNN